MICVKCNQKTAFGVLSYCPECYHEKTGEYPTDYVEEPEQDILPAFADFAQDIASVQPVTCNPIFGDYFNRGEVSILASDPKSGKTWLCLHVASILANGGQVFDRYYVEPKKVLFMFGDQDPGFLKDRADKLGYVPEYGKEKNLCVLSQNDFRVKRNKPMDLIDKKDFEHLMEFMQFYKPDLVFIDTLVSWTSVDEAKNKELRPLLMNLKELAGKTGAHICVLHHNRKEGAHGGSGLERIIGGTVITRLAGELYTLRCDIDEDSGEAKPQGWFKPLASWYASPKRFYYNISRESDTETKITFDFDKLIANTAEQRVLEEIEIMQGEWTTKDLEKITGESYKSVNRAVQKAVKGGLVTKLGTTRNARYISIGYQPHSATDQPF